MDACSVHYGDGFDFDQRVHGKAGNLHAAAGGVVCAEEFGVNGVDPGKIVQVRQKNGGLGDEFVERYSKGTEAVQALMQGKIDAVIIDSEPAKSFVAANEGLKILDSEYVVEDYAIAIAKENTELLEKVNKALAELKADGTLDAIVARYISAE